MGNWNWACEQMLAGKKVARKGWFGFHCDYFYMNNGCVNREDNCNAVLVGADMQATDWVIYREAKKWAKEQQEYAKALITLGGKYIACDKCGSIWAYKVEPHKEEDADGWISNKAMEHCIFGRNLEDIFGDKVKWEDDEPTLLQDIVDGEVE